MVRAMLTMDPTKRASARALLKHVWFKVAHTKPPLSLGSRMVQRLQQYTRMAKLRRLALVVLGKNMVSGGWVGGRRAHACMHARGGMAALGICARGMATSRGFHIYAICSTSHGPYPYQAALVHIKLRQCTVVDTRCLHGGSASMAACTAWHGPSP